MNVFLRKARARNGHVEATLNHPFPAQVLDARDRLLKPGGRLMPSRASMYWAPARLDGARDRRLRDHLERLSDWRRMERA